MHLQSFIVPDVFAVVATRILDMHLTTDYICAGQMVR